MEYSQKVLDEAFAREMQRLSVINRQLKVTIWLLILALVVAFSGIIILLAKLAEVT